MKPFYNNELYTLYLYIYLVDDILLHLNFQWVYSVGERICYYMRLLKYMCVSHLISVWYLTCWARTMNITLVNVSYVTIISYLQG